MLLYNEIRNSIKTTEHIFVINSDKRFLSITVAMLKRKGPIYKYI